MKYVNLFSVIVCVLLFAGACSGSGKVKDKGDVGQNADIEDGSGGSDSDDGGADGSAVVDTDNDGMPDEFEIANNLNPEDPADAETDNDGDGLTNLEEYNQGTDVNDADTDKDGVTDKEDVFPNDPTETIDSEGDGIGDNADPDDDNDGVIDEEDAFPNDPTETTDSEGDGIGDNADPDDDNDGVIDEEDAFPNDPTETTDTDGDGIGDNADKDNSDPTARWDTSTNVLLHYGEEVVLQGFSGTTTEYLFDGLGMNTFWNTDFSTPFQETTSRITMEMLSSYGQDNFSTIYENDMGMSGKSPEPENVFNRYFAEGIAARLGEVAHPVFRIPLTARYWLEGGKKVYIYEDQVTGYDSNSRTVSFSWGSKGKLVDSVEILETDGQFHFVAQYSAEEYQQYITDLVFYIKEEVPDAVIILDLHWNFDRFGDSSTFDTINDETSDSSVYAKQLPMSLDQDSTGSKAGSALRFWQSVSETFGYKGDSLVNGTKADASSTHTNHITLSDNPAVDLDFAKDIWFELYNEPWPDKFTNYKIDGNTPVSTNDNTNGTAPSDWDGFINGASSTTDSATFVGMMDLYAAVRERSDNHIVLSGGSNWGWGAEALIALNTAIDTNPSTTRENVILSVHPYMGWYQKDDKSKDVEGFYSVITALWTLNTPIMITEFGQYDGPGKINFNHETGTAEEPDDNWTFSGADDLSASSAGNSNLYQWYHYDGYWDSTTNTETGTAMSYTAAILKICEDHKIGWTAWASRPNSHEYASSIGATQPDVFTGVDASGKPDLRFTNPTTAFNPEHKDQPMVKESATGGGANWAYLWNRFAIME